MVRWAKENPKEFELLEDLFNFKTGFFEIYEQIAFSAKKGESAVKFERLVDDSMDE